MNEAVKVESYESAAEFRDRISDLKSHYPEIAASFDATQN
ncbi:hypothetical protein VDG1235_3271 [Verrucomicrobiia bacterium DG1235]|nr:hypothetical protein VDG1235_3271 [Verrucomicrobiae bacterium DG1235]